MLTFSLSGLLDNYQGEESEVSRIDQITVFQRLFCDN